MPKIKIYNQNGEPKGEKDLSEKVFGVEAANELLHQVVVAQMANRRKVLAHTKTRANVRGGGRKPWRQKGTGRARAGTIRSPLWIGGGIVFGPLKERNFQLKVNKKMNRKAMTMVLSDRAKSGNLILLDNIKIEEYKTKKFEEAVKNLEKWINNKTDEKKNVKRSLLIIIEKKDDKVSRSGRNLAGVEIVGLENINILDLLKYRDLILTEAAADKLAENYGKK